MANRQLRGLDIFCGAGGSSAGARAAGINMIGGIDMCPIATQTYAANFPNAKAITARLDELQIERAVRMIGEIDVLLASPECTNHSCAKGAAPRHEGSRATALHVIRYAQAFKPRWLVLENVVHMRPWSRYGELKKELEDLGYKIAEQVLDSSDFGVPQTRKRLFLVGDREGTPNLVSHKRSGRRRSAKAILDKPGVWAVSPLFHPARASATLERARRGFATLGPRTNFLLVYYGSDGSGGWQPLSRPLRTITTLDRFALVEHIGKEATIRMLQVPELKRAMGLDDGFVLPTGTRRDKIRLLGNGVCPPVMEKVLRSLTSPETVRG